MDKAQEVQPDLIPIFLTLTVRNCEGEDLSSTLDMMFKGWHKLINHRCLRGVMHGWFRTLEVTHDNDTIVTPRRYKKAKEYYKRHNISIGAINPNYDTYHPHLHILALVDKSYFSSAKYNHTTDWVRLWRVSCGFDYDPMCYVKEVRSVAPKEYRTVGEVRKSSLQSAISEVTKYTLKDSDYISSNEKQMQKVVAILGKALKGRRLFALGGVLKKIAKELGENLSEGDLVHIDEDSLVREDVANALTLYQWDFGLMDYIRQ
jgi:plasmid rolling circle replication initiator protein Rep